MHDARVLRQSWIGYTLQHLLQGTGFHLVADGAYPLSERIMTPYRNHRHMTEVNIDFREVDIHLKGYLFFKTCERSLG